MSAQSDLATILNRLKKRLSTKVDSAAMRVIGEFVVDEIKTRTRRGFGVSKLGGAEKKFDPLAKSYVERRKKMTLSPFTAPGKSNVTRSGRMLGGLRYTTQTGRAIIKPTGTSREGIANEDVAQFVTEGGRPFMTLSAIQIRRLLKFFEEKIFPLS